MIEACPTNEWIELIRDLAGGGAFFIVAMFVLYIAYKLIMTND